MCATKNAHKIKLEKTMT